MKSLLTILLVLLAIPVMAQDEPRLSPTATSKNLPEILGVCGPFHKALLNLGPRTSDGVLDTSRLNLRPIPGGLQTVEILGPLGVVFSIADQPPSLIRLFEFKGALPSLFLVWEGSSETKARIWNRLSSELTQVKGAPAIDESREMIWKENPIRTALTWPDHDLWVAVYLSCMPMEDEYWRIFKSESASENDTASTASSEYDPSVPDPWSKTSIVSILSSKGQPSEAPFEIGDDVVGLHYGGLDFDGTPYEFWYWFYEGKEIYSASEFLPGSGSSNAVGSFATMREMTIGMYGEPDETILGESGIRQRMIWRHGPLEFTFTFYEGDGNPWFLLETIDTTHLDKIGGDLRPSSTLPKRFEPPPPDSGKDRMDLTPEVAEG